MKSARFVWVTVAVCVALARPISTRGSEDLVSGKWQCHGKGPSGEEVHFLLDLKRSGDSLTGTVTLGEDIFRIEQGSIRANEMEIVISTDDNRFVSIATVEKRKLTATWKDANGNSGTWQGDKTGGEAN
jgi:hypothetical protein